MAVLFKDRFDYESLYKLALEIKAVYDGFPVEEFLEATMDGMWAVSYTHIDVYTRQSPDPAFAMALFPLLL